MSLPTINLVKKLILFLLFLQISTFCLGDDIRLQQNIIPKLYEITLYPNLENGTFRGRVSIDIMVNDYYKEIILHGKELEIVTNQTRLKRKTEGSFENIPVQETMINSSSELITVNLMHETYYGEYNLEIIFNGLIRDDMTGFYRSYYYYQGKKRWLGATQFEPHYARRAFPCFDEPHFRTNFTLEIVVPNTHQVISNVKPTNGLTAKTGTYFMYQFDSYLSMPTYLLAWVVFEKYTFISTDPYVINGTEYRLWTQADYINQTRHPNFVASKLLNALANFLDVPYSLNKMDQVAIPDFSAGAMENWGLVTYRESLLLHTDKIATTDDYRKITMVIAHEFTHQWFGNLVTLDWWSYTWLNEAFARYFQYFITLEVYTDWRLDEQFVILALQPALEYDSTPQNAMTSDVNNVTDINGKFDMVTYSKGASVVRMMDHILTKPNFKKGLSKYLKQLSELKPVATPNDLFKILSTVAPTNLPYNFETIMRSWTDQAGYPIVFVKRNNMTIQLEQKRGLYESKDSNITWYIPLTYTTKGESDFSNNIIQDWLTTSKKTLNITISPNDWIIFNVQQKGFFRVSYDDLSWSLIIKQLKTRHNEIDSLNRAQLIDDAFFLNKAGYLDMNTTLNITSYLVNDIDYAPWYPAVNGLNKLLDKFFIDNDTFTALKKYSLRLVSSVIDNVGFVGYTGDKMAQKLKRMTVLKFAGKLEHPTAVNIATQILNDLVNNSTTSYSPDIQEALLCTSLKHSSNISEWLSVYELYQNTPYATQKMLYLYSLTCSKNNDALTMLMKDTLSMKPKIRRQDSDRLFQEIGNTPNGAKYLLNFVTNNYTDLISYNFNKPKIISTIISGFSNRIYDKSDIDMLLLFNEKKKKELGDATYNKINSIITKINQNIDKATKEKENLKKWLNEVIDSYTTVAPEMTTVAQSETSSGSGGTTIHQAETTAHTHTSDAINVTSCSFHMIVISLIVSSCTFFI